MYVKSPLMKALAFSSATFLLSAQAYAGNALSCCFKGNTTECEKPAPEEKQENSNNSGSSTTKPAPQPDDSTEDL